MQQYAERYPHELSGGQQQRVALARTLVYRPDVLLLDEPLSNLDSKLRERARSWLSEMHKRVRQTTIYVTHDQVEALALSDRIIVMNAGRIVQIGTPSEVYSRPANTFVADFIGTSTFLTGIVEYQNAGQGTVRLKDGQMLLVDSDRLPSVGGAVVVAIRPERLELASKLPGSTDASSTTITAMVRAVTYLGARYQYDLDVCGEVLKVEHLQRFEEPTLSISIPAAACVAFPAETIS